MANEYIIRKNTGLQENVLNNESSECQYSDYELYQILESNGYKTTNKNKDLLKKGLKEGKYYIESDDDNPNNYDIELTEGFDLFSLLEDEIIPEIIQEDILDEKLRFGNEYSTAGRGNNLVLKYKAADISVESLVRDYIMYKSNNKQYKTQIPEAYLRSAARNDTKAEEIRSKIKEEVKKGKDQNKHKVDSLRISYFAALDRLYTAESKEERDSDNAVKPVRLTEDELKNKKDKMAAASLDSKEGVKTGAKIAGAGIAAAGAGIGIGAIDAAGELAYYRSKGLKTYGNSAAEFMFNGSTWAWWDSEHSHLLSSVAAPLFTYGGIAIAAIALIIGVTKAIKVAREKSIKNSLFGDENKAKGWLELQIAEFKKHPEYAHLITDFKKAKSVKEARRILKEICKALQKCKVKVKVDVADDKEDK